MAKKIYVKNLPFTTTEQELQEKCSEFGSVSDVRIIKDRETQRSRGFAFVTFTEENSAEQAISGLDGYKFQGRDLKVEVAIDKQNSSRGFQRINS